ncbi:MAG: CPBP family intramembrane glutamic endopeptidase [Balneolaceae bacterium]|nr:CPBP family intramembrane glutamic endopeptidase [Balneolaceae bacterium]
MKGQTDALSRYFRDTHTLLYSYLIALPLLLLYEILIVISQPNAAGAVRISVDVWIRTLFTWLGTGVLSITLILAALAGIVIVWRERDKLSTLRGGYFAGMLLESTVYALALAMLISSLVGGVVQLLQDTAGVEALTTLQQVALSLGAGLYEELFFRVVLVGGLYFVARRLLDKRWLAFALSVVTAALIFSGVHYVGALGDTFTLGSFLFRFLFGLALNAIYLWRGFGVAAWTHAIYDIMVVAFL